MSSEQQCVTFSIFTLYRFLIDDKETFFTSGQRIRMVYDILIRTPWDPDETEVHTHARNMSVTIYRRRTKRT
jgi:hypothetical protein